MTEIDQVREHLAEAIGLLGTVEAQAADQDSKVRSLEDALDEANGEAEDLERQVGSTESRAFEAVQTATRLHERRHQGPLRFCTDEACTAWADLFREWKVDH